MDEKVGVLLQRARQNVSTTSRNTCIRGPAITIDTLYNIYVGDEYLENHVGDDDIHAESDDDTHNGIHDDNSS